MQVKAIKTHSYRGLKRNAGESYEINSKSDLKTLQTIGLISADASNNEMQDMSIEKKPRANKTGAAKRTYNRRDLAAQ